MLVEHGGSGPEIAAPVAMQIVREYERLQAIRLGHPPSAKSPPREAGASREAPAVRLRSTTSRRPPRPRARALRLDAVHLVAALLAVIGVINLYSATSVARGAHSDDYIQQIYWLVGGGILATVVAAIDYRHYERLGYALYGGRRRPPALVFILGRDIRGSSRWIYIGSYSFQPSEFMKLFLRHRARRSTCTTTRRAKGAR